MNPYLIYIAKGEWKCEPSPNGAHHWVIDSRGRGECKYCHTSRMFNSTPMLQGDVQQMDFAPSR